MSSEDSSDGGRTTEQKLNSIIDSALDSFDMEFQFEQATKDLTYRMETMKEDFDETDKLFKEVEVDTLRKELYH